MKKILFVGETWMIHSVHQKGFDSFTSSHYGEGVIWIKEALEKGGFDFTHIANHRVQYDFPKTVEELNEYDVVMLSDIGSNTLLVSDNVFMDYKREPNKIDLIKEYVLQGGAFAMIGGYMAFSGVDGSSRYGETAIQDILPVTCLNVDDRVERPEGIHPVVINDDHKMFKEMDKEWPFFLGYNKTIIKEDAELLATIGEGDPFIATSKQGKGKTAVFTSDCAPHWGSEDFVNWEYYNKFWTNFVEVLLDK